MLLLLLLLLLLLRFLLMLRMLLMLLLRYSSRQCLLMIYMTICTSHNLFHGVSGQNCSFI